MSKTNSKRVWTAMDEANTDNTASVVDMYLPSLPPAQNQAIQDVIESMLEDFLFEEVIEVMWCIRTGQWTLDDIYGVKSLSSIDTTSKKKASNTSNLTNHSSSHQASSSSSATLCHFASQRAVVCSLCGEAVAGSRYAPHLEKCMNGGKRGSKKHYDSLQDSVYKSKYKKEFVDPYPNSLVVRIRYKNGVLYGNTRRIGVSEEEFKAAQEEAANPSVIEVVEETAKDTNDSMPVGPIDLIVDEVKATTASKAVLIDVIL